MGRPGRPTSHDVCRDPHRVGDQVYRCGRRIGHAGDHGHGKIKWPRRIAAPPSGSSAAASPMR